MQMLSDPQFWLGLGQIALINVVLRHDRVTILRELTASLQQPSTPAIRRDAKQLLEELRQTQNLVEQLLPREILGEIAPLASPFSFPVAIEHAAATK